MCSSKLIQFLYIYLYWVFTHMFIFYRKSGNISCLVLNWENTKWDRQPACRQFSHREPEGVSLQTAKSGMKGPLCACLYLQRHKNSERLCGRVGQLTLGWSGSRRQRSGRTPPLKPGPGRTHTSQWWGRVKGSFPPAASFLWNSEEAKSITVPPQVQI